MMNVLLENGEALDLNSDFKLNISLTNPLLSEQGSMSLPVLLPESDHNRHILGFPGKLENTYKWQNKRDVIINSGSSQIKALLKIDSTNSPGIEGAFYLNESPFYSKMKDANLAQAFDVIRKPDSMPITGVFANDMEKMITYLENVMLGNIEDDFYLFAVGVDYYEESFGEVLGVEQTFKFYQLLNEHYSSNRRGNPEDYPIIYELDIHGQYYLKLRGREAHKYHDGDDLIDVPVGYGITPFLKQSYMLRRIFTYLGYQLEISVFDTNPEFQKIVLLNNTADAIVKGQVDYKQLVPDCTIKEYLDTVRADYGCEFFVAPDHKHIFIRFWNDILNNKDEKFKILDPHIAGNYRTRYVDPKLLKITYKRSNEFAATSATTLDQFELKYGKLGFVKEIHYGNLHPGIGDGFYVNQSTGDIFELYTKLDESGAIQLWKFHSRYLFDSFEENEDLEYDTHDSSKEFCPSVGMNVRYIIDTNNNITLHGYYRCLLFIGSRRHMNTNVKEIKTDDQGVLISIDQKEDIRNCPIMTAFWRGRMLLSPGNPTETVVYGTTYNYDNLGDVADEINGFHLMPGGINGLCDKFWKKYADVLRHSFHQVVVPLHFTSRDIAAHRMDELALLDGQPLLPEQLDYVEDMKGNVVVNEAIYRTIRLYKDREE